MSLPDYPGAILVMAHPSNILRAANQPKVLVLHTPEEPADNVESTPYYFQRPNLGASTHYYADSDGDMYQMVAEINGAIANGVRGKPYPAGTNSRASLNYQSLSIEIEGYAAGIALTMPRGGVQWKAVVRWVASRAKKYGIPLVRSRIIGHYEVANNRTDPGTLDIDAIVADARAAEEDDVSKELEAKMRVAGWFAQAQGLALAGQPLPAELAAKIAFVLPR